LRKEDDSFHPVKDIAARFELQDVRQGPPVTLEGFRLD